MCLQFALKMKDFYEVKALPPIVPKTVCDRELFSELFETHLHPMILNMVPLYVDVANPTFDLQINGEGDGVKFRKAQNTV